MKRFLISSFLLMTVLVCGFTVLVSAQGKVFTAEELSQYDGKDGAAAYYAYEGKVYDVTSSDLWKDGEHYGLQAGQDLTGKMGDAPHGTEVFAPFPVVGVYQDDAMKVAEPSVPTMAVSEKRTTTNQKWYEGRIRILGISILGWTGILLGIFFVLTFATCFAMPWAKLPVPWKGKRIGPDQLDESGVHMKWTSVHKYFVWWTVILGIIHGVIGLLQMAGIYL